MSCKQCAPIEAAVNAENPHVIRICKSCGGEYRAQESALHGYGFKIKKGDQVRIPAGTIQLSANPLQGKGQLTRAGISWFAEMVFQTDFARKDTLDSLEAKLTELQEANERFFVEAPVLEGLDPEDPENEQEVFDRLNANPKTIEWWGYMAAGFANIARRAVENGDARQAAWSSIAAERFRALAVFRSHFEEAVFMGNSAGRLVQLLRIWEANRTNPVEGFWQETFRQHAYAFGQLFAAPVAFLQDGAYVGGTKINRKDARYVDFILSGGLSDSAMLVEIKTPTTPLLGAKYRGNAYSPSAKLSGSVVQIGDYLNTLREELRAVSSSLDTPITTFNPRRLIVIGTYRDELDDPKKRASFELFRGSLSGIDIITFDELFGKIEDLAKLFNIVRTVEPAP